MAVEVVVPQMGESVLEGTILEWKVKIGDKVKLNQALVELMTDKINIEIPAEVEGVITELLAEEGEVVKVGARIAIIDDGSGSEIVSAAAESSAPANAAISSGSASATAVASATEVAPPPPSAKAVKASGGIGRGKMSPKVKMLVREYSIDPSILTPTGKEGRLTVEDVMRSVESRSTEAGFSTGPVPSPPLPTPNIPAAALSPTAAAPRFQVTIPVFEPLPVSQRERREPVQGVRKLISDHMINSVRTSPHVTTFEDIDMTELVKFRQDIKQSFIADYGANLTYLPFIVKAVCTGLKEFPRLNASMTDKEIIYKNFYNIGIAVAREEGLIVPVIKDADKKTIIELAVEISSLGMKARTNKLVPDDISGGTFSLTNAGMFGATASTPIINQPQVAILGIHAIVKKPCVVDGEIVPRDISTFALSFDHRLIDGHVAVQFLHRVHQYLADVRQLLLHTR